MMTEAEFKLHMRQLRRAQHEAQGYHVDENGTCWRGAAKQALKDDRNVRRAERRAGIRRPPAGATPLLGCG